MEITPEQLSAITAALEQAQNVTPLGVVGYSFAVLVLGIVGWIFYSNWKRSEARVADLVEKMIKSQETLITFMTKVELRMNDQQDHGSKIDSIHNMVEQVKTQMQEVRDIIKKNG